MIRSYQYSDGTSLDKNRPKVEPPAAAIPPGLVDPSYHDTNIPTIPLSTGLTRPADWYTPDAFLPGEEKIQMLVALPLETSYSFTTELTGTSCVIDWGDGSATEPINGQLAHTYTYVPGTTSIHRESVTNYSATADVFTGKVHDNKLVRLSNISGLSNVATDTDYYVVNYSNNTFQLSATFGGTPIAVGSGSADVEVALYAWFKVVITGTAMSYSSCEPLNNYPVSVRELLVNSPTLGGLSLLNNTGYYLESYSTSQYTNVWTTMNQKYAFKWSPFGIHAPLTGSTFTNWFQYNYSLVEAPNIYFSGGGTLNASNMFQYCYNLEDISNIDFSNVTTIGSLGGWLAYTKVSELPPSWDWSKITNVSGLFSSAFNFVEIPPFTLPPGLTSINGLFSSCGIHSIPAIDMSAYADGSLSASNLASYCPKLDNIDNLVPLVSKFTDLSYAFSTTNLASIPALDLTNVSGVQSMFSQCTNLRYANGITWGTNIKNYSSMFDGCSSLLELPENFPFAYANSLASTFSGCYALQGEINISVPNAVSIASMFYSCYNITSLTISNLNSVTSANSLASSCTKLRTATLGTFANNIYLSSAFSNCIKLTDVTIDFSNVLGMSQTFDACNKLTSINSGADLHFPICGDFYQTFRYTYMPELTIYIGAASIGFSNTFYNAQIGKLSIHQEVGTSSVISASNMLYGMYFTDLYIDPNITYTGTLPYNLNISRELNKQVWRIDNSSSNQTLTLTSGIKILDLEIHNAQKLSSFTASSNGSLVKLGLYGMVNTTNVANNKLIASEINRLFESLGNAVSPGVTTITVTGNPGAATCDTNIATTKDWNVVIS